MRAVSERARSAAIGSVRRAEASQRRSRSPLPVAAAIYLVHDPGSDRADRERRVDRTIDVREPVEARHAGAALVVAIDVYEQRVALGQLTFDADEEPIVDDEGQQAPELASRPIRGH
ncbi:MAG: hypothetical protein KF729_12370 [Sandaracinaceae bacterium]|nr:hypothetical protein [Sandaracinaceae bacterium]